MSRKMNNGGWVLRRVKARQRRFDHNTSLCKAILKYEKLCTVKDLLRNGADVNESDCHGNTALVLALRNDSELDVIEELLRNGADVNVRFSDKNVPFQQGRPNDAEQSNPLKIALQKNRIVVAAFLVMYGAEIDSGYCSTEIMGSLLHVAAEVLNPKLVRILLMKGASADAKNDIGETPVFTTLRKSFFKSTVNNSIAVIKELSKFKADMNVINDDGYTPIHFAVEMNYYVNSEICRALVESGADINSLNENKQTPLHLAAQKKQEELVKEFLRLGANVSVRDCLDNTPLRLAIKSAAPLGVLKDLIQNGANINEWYSDGNKPLSEAMHMNGKLGIEVIKEFIRNGADFNECDQDGNTFFHLTASATFTAFYRKVLDRILMCGGNVNKKNNRGITPLMCAAIANNSDGVKEMLKLGANVNDLDFDNNHSLHHAAREYSNFQRLIQVILILLKHGASVSVKNKESETPLHVFTKACLKKYDDDKTERGKVAKRKLITMLANKHLPESVINEQNSEGNTALHLATGRIISIDVVNALLLCGSDVNASNNKNLTPLFNLIKFCSDVDRDDRSFVWRRLIAFGAVVNTTDNQNMNPLLIACRYGDGLFLEAILEEDTPIEGRDIDGNTALLLAAFRPISNSHYTKKSQLKVIKQLLQRGADVEETNNRGRTPCSLLCLNEDLMMEYFEASCNDGFDMNRAVRNLILCDCDPFPKGICFKHFEVNGKRPVMFSIGENRYLNSRLIKKLGKKFFEKKLTESVIFCTDCPRTKKPIYLDVDCVMGISKYLNVKNILYCILALGSLRVLNSVSENDIN